MFMNEHSFAHKNGLLLNTMSNCDVKSSRNIVKIILATAVMILNTAVAEQDGKLVAITSLHKCDVTVMHNHDVAAVDL